MLCKKNLGGVIFNLLTNESGKRMYGEEMYGVTGQGAAMPKVNT